MKLSRNDIETLKSMGYLDKDISQIGQSIRKTEYTKDGEKISAERAREILGQRIFLSGQGRAAFHGTAYRESNGGPTSHIFFNVASEFFR